MILPPDDGPAGTTPSQGDRAAYLTELGGELRVRHRRGVDHVAVGTDDGRIDPALPHPALRYLAHMSYFILTVGRECLECRDGLHVARVMGAPDAGGDML